MLVLKMVLTILDLLIIFVLVVYPSMASSSYKSTESEKSILKTLSILIAMNAVSMWL